MLSCTALLPTWNTGAERGGWVDEQAWIDYDIGSVAEDRWNELMVFQGMVFQVGVEEHVCLSLELAN